MSLCIVAPAAMAAVDTLEGWRWMCEEMGDVSFIYCYKWEGRWADAG